MRIGMVALYLYRIKLNNFKRSSLCGEFFCLQLSNMFFIHNAESDQGSVKHTKHLTKIDADMGTVQREPTPGHSERPEVVNGLNRGLGWMHDCKVGDGG